MSPVPPRLLPLFPGRSGWRLSSVLPACLHVELLARATEIKSSWSGDVDHIRLAQQSDSLFLSDWVGMWLRSILRFDFGYLRGNSTTSVPVVYPTLGQPAGFRGSSRCGTPVSLPFPDSPIKTDPKQRPRVPHVCRISVFGGSMASKAGFCVRDSD